MAKGLSNHGVALGQIRTLFDGGAVAGLSDGELLARFLDDRGELREAAFEALVHRHGPLVFGVCRRTLRNSHQSEDAFQATFLLLAKKARSIRNREAVGPWLVGVAVKVAARARGESIRRRTQEAKAASLSNPWLVSEPGDRDEIADLLHEVDRLRAPLREAVVLCHLQGLSYDSAAEVLGVTESTIRGRLARARDQLRVRLGTLHELSPSLPLLPLLLQSVPERLIGPTVRGSMALASGQAASGIVPGSAITLMKGVLKTMMLAKWKLPAMLVLAISLITLGSTIQVQARQRPKAAKAPTASKSADPKGDADELAKAAPGKIVRSGEVTADCMILSYLPDWGFGNVDNIGIANNNGGVRTLVNWTDVAESDLKSSDLKFFLAFYSRTTTTKSRLKPSAILAFELSSEWPELTSWKSQPEYETEPAFSTKFEPGDGWKFFDITQFVRDRQGKSGHGLLFRFLSEDRRTNEDWSGYAFVSREGTGEWAGRRPRLLVVEPSKK